MNLAKDEDGNLRFLKPDGTAKFVIPAPLMWDSSGIEGVREAALVPVATSITSLGGDKWNITLNADNDWLASPDRVYPVYIDPTTTLGDSNMTAYKSDGATRTDHVQVGNSRDSNTDKYWRSRVKYDYSGVYGKQVLGARVYATYIAGTTTSRTGSVYTVSGSGYSSVGDKLATLTVDTDGSTSSTNATLPQTISDWVTDGVQHTIMIRGAETAGAYTYKSLDTTLKVTYKDFPSVSGMSSASPEDGAHVAGDITLGATIADSGGSDIQVQYGLWDNEALAGTPALQSGWLTSNEFVITANSLASDSDYYWQVSVKDSSDGIFGVSTLRTSAVWSFTPYTDDPDYMPGPLVEIVAGLQDSPNYDLMNGFEWDGSTQTLEIHYVNNLAALQTWLDPALSAHLHTYVLDTFTSDEITAAESAVVLGTELAISSIAPTDNNAGLQVVVSVEDTEPLTLEDSISFSTLRKAFNEDDESYPDRVEVTLDSGEIINVPLSYDLVSEDTESLDIFDRQKDTSPFAGGASFYNGETFSHCTTGFAAYKDSTKVMVTAGHCGSNGDTAYGSQAPGMTSSIIGTFASGNTDSDYKVISLDSDAKVEGKVYTGKYTSTSKAKVKGVIHVVKGSKVCVEGALSGEHCGVEVTEVNGFVHHGFWPWDGWYGMVHFKGSDDTKAIVGKGDSGGTVVVPVDGGVRITGVLSSANGIDKKVATCTGTNLNNRQCYSSGWYADERRFFAGNVGWKTVKG